MKKCPQPGKATLRHRCFCGHYKCRPAARKMAHVSLVPRKQVSGPGIMRAPEPPTWLVTPTWLVQVFLRPGFWGSHAGGIKTTPDTEKCSCGPARRYRSGHCRARETARLIAQECASHDHSPAQGKARNVVRGAAIATRAADARGRASAAARQETRNAAAPGARQRDGRADRPMDFLAGAKTAGISLRLPVGSGLQQPDLLADRSERPILVLL